MNELEPLLELIGAEARAVPLAGWDSGAILTRGGHQVELAVEFRSGPAGRATVDRFLGRVPPPGHIGMLVAIEIPPSARERLRAEGRAYLDGSGNAYLADGPLLIHLDGRSTRASTRRQPGVRSAGMRVIGALLADPALLDQSLRTVAAQCGVSTKAVRAARAKLAEQGQFVTRCGSPVLAAPADLRESWLIGYRELIRPRLSAGRFHLPQDDPAVLARLFDEVGVDWAYGGSRGAAQHVQTTIGSDVVIHLAALERPAPPSFLRPLAEGPVEVLGIPALPFWSTPVHPLLCLAEIAWRRDPRSREIAADLRELLPS